MTSRLIVFVYLRGATEPVPAGVLEWDDPADPGSIVTFVYGRRYVERPDAAALDPRRLPLDASARTSAQGLTGALAVFSNALPDAWGRLMGRPLNGGRPLTHPELLLVTARGQRTGALDFGTDPAAPPGAGSPAAVTALDDLYEAVRAVEEGRPVDGRLAALLRQGSSLGGARPKETCLDGGRLWIAKLPSREDHQNIARVEYATMTLAREAGIRVPEMQVVPLHGDREALLVDRFDREPLPGGALGRLPYMSARVLCGTPRAESSYLLLADALRRDAVDPDADRRELFRRMAFNAAVNNVDDHGDNHGVLLEPNGQVRLTPAFDIVAGAGTGRYQAMEVGPEGRSGHRDNLLAAAPRFGLDHGEAEVLIQDVRDAAAGWREVFARCGVSDAEAAAWAF